MNKFATGIMTSFATFLLLAAAPHPQDTADPIPVCPGCTAFVAGLPPTCPTGVTVTVDRKLSISGLCGCVGAECLQARTCLAAYQMTVTDATGAHVFSASTNQCGGYDEAHPSGRGCGPGFIFVTCTPCAESCL